MRTQFSKIALAATLGIAITLTLSCSSDNIGDGGGGGVNGGSSNLSDLPKDAYLIEYDDDDKIDKKNKYDGNGEITLRIYLDKDEYGEKYETKPAGKIQNGQVSLNLPDIESEYLKKWTGMLFLMVSIFLFQKILLQLKLAFL
jgi:hypothetical protein